MSKQPVSSALKDEIRVFGNEFWEALRIKRGRLHDVWGGNSRFSWPELKLITPCLKFLISNGYDLRRVELDLLVWILLQVPTEDLGLIMGNKIHIEIRRDVVAMISVVHRVSIKGTWLDLVSSAFLKEVTGQEPARIGEEVVEKVQTTPAPPETSDASSVTGNPVISWGETGFSDPPTTIPGV